MLRWRILLGAILIGGLVALSVWDWLAAGPGGPYAPPGGWLFPLAIVATVLASGEIVRLVRKSAPGMSSWVVYLGNLLIVGVNIIPLAVDHCPMTAAAGALGWPLVAFILSVGLAFLDEMRRYERPGPVIGQLAGKILGLAYVGGLMTFVVQLRLYHFAAGPQGLVALLSLIIVVKMGDTGAYTVGRLIGRHKMAPVLSPGKTWEGFAGAMLFAAFGSWLFLKLVVPHFWPHLDPASHRDGFLAQWNWLPYGLIVGLTGLLGDLAESLLKRDAGVKDSSDWMPGFGGVLDVLDSILFAAPIAWLFWVMGWV